MLRNITENCPPPRKPSRGISVSESRTIINGNRVFRFDCERCRFSRGAGFTLAEVLITLGIIGVVAAMTLPSLIQNHKNKVLESQFKKSYSLISQAMQSVIMEEYGGFAYFNCDNLNSLITSVSKRYKNASTSWPVLEDYPNNNSGDTYRFMSATYKTGRFNDGIIQVLDGSTVFFDVGATGDIIGDTVLVGLDVNGWQKKPNKLGHDFFAFQLQSDGKLIPMGAENTFYPEDTYCSKTSNVHGNGLGCTSKALGDANYFNNL